MLEQKELPPAVVEGKNSRLANSVSLTAKNPLRIKFDSGLN